MHRSLGLGASLAAAAVQAVIIPSTMVVDNSELNAMTLAGVDPFNQLLRVDCNGCLYAQMKTWPNGMIGSSWTEGIPNQLLANFTVSDDLHTLRFNDVAIYPAFAADQSPQARRPNIRQVLKSASMEDILTDIKDVTPVLRFSSTPLELSAWGWSTQGQPTADGKELLLTIHVTLGSLAGQVVDVPEITAQLLKNENEELMLLRVEAAESTKQVDAPKKECHDSDLLCKWRSTIADTFSAVRTKIHGWTEHPTPNRKPGCKGKGRHGKAKGKGHHHHHNKVNGPDDEKSPFAPHVHDDWWTGKHHHPSEHGWKPKSGDLFRHGGHEHHRGPPKMHHHPHHAPPPSFFERAMNTLGDAFNHILAPIFIGLLAGFLVALFGSTVAVIVSIIVARRAGRQVSWVSFVPMWRRGYAAVELDGEDDDQFGGDEDAMDVDVDVEKQAEVADDEKTGLLAVVEEGEAPPVYTEAEQKPE